MARALAKKKQAFAVMVSIAGQEPIFRRLDTPIIRVGNHPRCEIVLPELYVARLIAVIETRPGAVVLHNKSGHPFHSDSGDLEPNRSCTWFDGQTIEINSYVRVALIAKIKPRLGGPENPSEIPSEESKVWTPKTIACAVVGGLILAKMAFESLFPANVPPDLMSELVQQAQNAHVDDPVKTRISFLLQEARIARQRYGQFDADQLAAASDLLIQERIRRRDGPVDQWYERAYQVIAILLKRAESGD